MKLIKNEHRWWYWCGLSVWKKVMKVGDLICKNNTNIITLVLKRSFQDRVSNLEFALRDILSHVILLLIRNSFHNSKLFLSMLDDQRLQYFK